MQKKEQFWQDCNATFRYVINSKKCRRRPSPITLYYFAHVDKPWLRGFVGRRWTANQFFRVLSIIFCQLATVDLCGTLKDL